MFPSHQCRLQGSQEGAARAESVVRPPLRGIRHWGLHERGADELRRCQEVADVDALDVVERVGGEDDDFQIRVGLGALRVDANG